MATLHYASGGSATDVATAGFNLVDVSSVDELNALPAGTKGLVWLDEANGATSSFIDKVTPFIGNPKVFGFFLVDEPDPTGKWGTYATADNLKAESDWIHTHLPGAKTFITMMNMGSSADPDFSNTFNPANTHIDYYGVDPYPVRTGTSTVDYNMIDRTVAAAVASGVPLSQIVPVYQTFGGGNYTTDTGGQYVLPSVAQEQTMLDHWAKVAPSPAFDYAYAWGSQQGDTALGDSPELQALFQQHNLSSAASAPATPTPSTSETSSTPGIPPSTSGTQGSPGTASTPSTQFVANPSDGRHHNSDGADLIHGTGAVHHLANASHWVTESAGVGRGIGLASLADAGSDAFAFDAGALAARGADRPTDFSVSQQKFHLDHALGLHTGAPPNGALVAGMGSHDGSDHIIYNSSTGALSFDNHGTGGAHHIEFAHFPAALI
ncbi:calcium-binding protein (plasmid) [Mesorhizobium loti]|uniref:Calcium-binding protein n=1 Tax=Mesorhizobium jarvisii TaxID=1777867 RepID=A0A6M7TT76_9HYPH|nr:MULTISPECIES: DNA-binding protein [Mesorhizobium]OBQ71080.1 DNA-binding protein [Mesorhizobium loti]QKC67456.1 calcium-binding protein [Mesorhizobium jarvisii]QKD13370.1 calcium-binding protein [Mesorhizobium loti]RJT29310.1 calcium-binding protein [Mesorhizobium jarvisii]